MTQPRDEAPSVDAAPDAVQLDPLEQQLSEARAELEALERVLEQLPEVFEHKFKQRLATVSEVNQHLLEQQRILQKLTAEALPAAQPRPQRRLALPSINVPRLAPIVSRRAGLLLLSGVALLGFGGAAAWLLRPPQRQAEAPPAARQLPLPVASESLLVLKALGTSWVEVQDLATREVLLIGELQAGDERRIRMRRGLLMRSGRPDLLTVAIDDAPATVFGDIHGLDWRPIIPPKAQQP